MRGEKRWRARISAVFHLMNEGRTGFAQLTRRESLRDSGTCLAVANEKRAWHIFAAFVQGLIQQATVRDAVEPFRFERQAAAYALDATAIARTARWTSL